MSIQNAGARCDSINLDAAFAQAADFRPVVRALEGENDDAYSSTWEIWLAAGGLTSECPISQTFDRDGNGFIGASDLHNTYLAINEDLNDDEVKWNRFLMV